VIWAAILAGSLGCYALKFAGLAVPASVLRSERVQRIAALLPVALLAALAAVQTFTTGQTLVVDPRAVALLVAGALVARRAPFLVVVVGAAATAAVLRLLGVAGG
jgi:branched-subunit amino acid transport protein